MDFLTFLYKAFHLFPCLCERPLVMDVALSIWKCGDEGVVPRWIQGNGPMDEVHWKFSPLLSLEIST